MLIRIPHALGVFKEKTLLERVAAGIRAKLLSEKLDERVNEMESVVKRQKSSMIGAGTGGSESGKTPDADDEFFRIKDNGEPVTSGQVVPVTEEEKKQEE